jgi:hypothetical protein
MSQYYKAFYVQEKFKNSSQNMLKCFNKEIFGLYLRHFAKRYDKSITFLILNMANPKQNSMQNTACLNPTLAVDSKETVLLGNLF